MNPRRAGTVLAFLALPLLVAGPWIIFHGEAFQGALLTWSGLTAGGQGWLMRQRDGAR